MADLRLEYMGLRDALATMELESERLKEVDREAARERVRATLANAVVGTIKPARRNKAKARSKSAAHRAIVEGGNKIGKKQKKSA